MYEFHAENYAKVMGNHLFSFVGFCLEFQPLPQMSARLIFVLFYIFNSIGFQVGCTCRKFLSSRTFSYATDLGLHCDTIAFLASSFCNIGMWYNSLLSATAFNKRLNSSIINLQKPYTVTFAVITSYLSNRTMYGELMNSIMMTRIQV